MEFCTKQESENQTAHSIYERPLVVAKELIDNALDACEEAEVAPTISIAVDPGTIVVQDDADGIAADTIKAILDYTIRSPRDFSACALPWVGIHPAKKNTIQSNFTASNILMLHTPQGLHSAAKMRVFSDRRCYTIAPFCTTLLGVPYEAADTLTEE
jgi:hypothetical protein